MKLQQLPAKKIAPSSKVRMAVSAKMDEITVGMIAGVLKRCCARVKKLHGKAERLGVG